MEAESKGTHVGGWRGPSEVKGVYHPHRDPSEVPDTQVGQLITTSKSSSRGSDTSGLCGHSPHIATHKYRHISKTKINLKENNKRPKAEHEFRPFSPLKGKTVPCTVKDLKGEASLSQTDFDLGNVVPPWPRQLTGPDGKQATWRTPYRPRAEGPTPPHPCIREDKARRTLGLTRQRV